MIDLFSSSLSAFALLSLLSRSIFLSIDSISIPIHFTGFHLHLYLSLSLSLNFVFFLLILSSLPATSEDRRHTQVPSFPFYPCPLPALSFPFSSTIISSHPHHRRHSLLVEGQ